MDPLVLTGLTELRKRSTDSFQGSSLWPFTSHAKFRNDRNSAAEVLLLAGQAEKHFKAMKSEGVNP